MGTDKLLFAYIDGELRSCDETLVSDHLACCKQCRIKYKLLTTAKKSLKKKHEETLAPSYLADKIRNSIKTGTENQGTTKRQLYYSPIFALAAALVLVIAVAFFQVRPCQYGHIHATNPFTGKVVCIGCEYHKKHPETASPCETHGHHAAIMTADGRIWHIFPTANVKEILDYSNSKNKTLQFSGEFFNEAQLLKIDDFSLL